MNGRYKAFLWVGIAYFLIAVLAPAAILLATQASWVMPMKGITWSLLAGVVGGDRRVLRAARVRRQGHPAVVMSIIFAGAPIVNAVVVITKHRAAWRLLGDQAGQFMFGIVLAAVGGMLVTLYRPPTAEERAATPRRRPGRHDRRPRASPFRGGSSSHSFAS